MKPLNLSKNDINLIQPNKVTNARYKFTELEENILTLLIHALQDYMTKDYPTQCDLFGNPLVQINLREAKYKNFRKSDYMKAAKTLITKSISFDWKSDYHKQTVETTTTFISAIHNIKGTALIELTLNHWAIPYLIHWSSGHTKFNKGIALTLQGVHTKRLYKLLKQWQSNREDYGAYTTSIDTLRIQFGLENKYKNTADFVRYVIEPSQERMKDKSDIYFNYKLEKSKGSRAYDNITFLIHQNNKKLAPTDKNGMYQLVYHVICWAFNPMESTKARDLTDILSNDPDELYKAYVRFKKEYEAFYGSRKDMKKIVPLIKYILKEDYGLF